MTRLRRYRRPSKAAEMETDRHLQAALAAQQEGIRRNQQLERRARAVRADLDQLSRENNLMGMFSDLLKLA